MNASVSQPNKEQFKSWIKLLLKETSNEQAQYAMGYRRGQSNYLDGQVMRDFTGYSESFVKGYKQGVRDGRMGRFSNAVSQILTSLADVLGRGKWRP
jgi:flagellar biosynthesis/type III secretory pathway protein FliH